MTPALELIFYIQSQVHKLCTSSGLRNSQCVRKENNLILGYIRDPLIILRELKQWLN